MVPSGLANQFTSGVPGTGFFQEILMAKLVVRILSGAGGEGKHQLFQQRRFLVSCCNLHVANVGSTLMPGQVDVGILHGDLLRKPETPPPDSGCA